MIIWIVFFYIHFLYNPIHSLFCCSQHRLVRSRQFVATGFRCCNIQGNFTSLQSQPLNKSPFTWISVHIHISLSISISLSLSLPLCVSASFSLLFAFTRYLTFSFFLSFFLSHSLSHTLSFSISISLDFSLSLSLALYFTFSPSLSSSLAQTCVRLETFFD